MAVPLGDIEPLRHLLVHQPLGVFSDIDGTLSPIVDNPADARVSPRCRELLLQLMIQGVRVALITGRPPETAQRMADLAGAVYAANHGMTVVIDGREESPEPVREFMARAKLIYNETSGIAEPGVFVEVTGPNLAYHYRQAADENASLRAIRSAIDASPAARGYLVREGRKVVELRPPVAINKGTALSDLVARLGIAAILCLGDDQTDIDMFRAVEALREHGLPGVNIAVQSSEAAPEVLENADYYVAGVAGVEDLLQALVTALGETER